MSTKDQKKVPANPQDSTLSDAEYWAVYDWINAEKDLLPSPLKEGLLKLVNSEGRHHS